MNKNTKKALASAIVLALSFSATPLHTSQPDIVKAAEPEITASILPTEVSVPDLTDSTISTPMPTVTPTPTMIIPPLYDNFFWMQTDSIYNEAYSEIFVISGDYMGLNNIYYKGKKLVKGEDYTVSNNVLKFSDDFLASLPYGENEFEAYVNFNPSATNALRKFTITKVNETIKKTYTPQYPLSETSEFNTRIAICSKDTDQIMYGTNHLINIDKVFIDNLEVEPAKPGGPRLWETEKNDELGGYAVCFYKAFYSSFSIGVHTIEVVSNGTSEVIYFVMFDDSKSAAEILAEACKPVSDMKLNIGLSTSAGSSISQLYTIKQADSTNSLELDKLKIRYYYDKVGDKPQSFACDNAGISLNEAPYYMDYTKNVTGSFGDGYVEIGFDDSYNLANNSLQLGVRFNQNDWSAYTEFQEGYVEAYYDGDLVFRNK